MCTHVIRTNKMHTFYIVLTIVSSTCFEHPSVHSQDDLYTQFYSISFMLPYKQSGRELSTRLLIWKWPKHVAVYGVYTIL
jgi:hypothetical protein